MYCSNKFQAPSLSLSLCSKQARTRKLIYNIRLICGRGCHRARHILALFKRQETGGEKKQPKTNHLPNFVFLKSISCAGSLCARASMRPALYLPTRKRRLLLRIPHSGCPTATSPNMKTKKGKVRSRVMKNNSKWVTLSKVSGLQARRRPDETRAQPRAQHPH